MNRVYHNEFKGLDKVSNRLEILTDAAGTTDTEIKTGGTPLVLQYIDVTKFEPVRSAQATMRLISQTNFQFVNLHTDNMQGYRVDFYRGGSLFWTGWLDSELYTEELAKSAPYEVEFSAADFNIWERLKYRDDDGNKYNDIAPLFTHLRRCLDKLGLPFQKLYIGCSTTPDGISLSASDTALHVLYVMSANFYDEDGEPMTCREVVESLLRPFGLMMVQKDANVYIYDYNTLKQGLSMKRYNASTFAYEAAETVDFDYGNLLDIGPMSTDGDYGFEEMYNNVTITSSLYGDRDGAFSYEVDEDKLENLVSTSEQPGYTLKKYGKCDPWDSGYFLHYENKRDTGIETLMGAEMIYTGDESASNQWTFDGERVFLIGSDAKNYIRVKADAYINTRDDPFDTDVVEDDIRTQSMAIFGDLVLYNNEDVPVMYFLNDYFADEGWKSISDGSYPTGKFVLGFIDVSGSVSDSRIANEWRTNGQVFMMSGGGFSVPRRQQSTGQRVIVPPLSGYLILRLRYCKIMRATLDKHEVFPADRVKSLLIDNVSMTFEDENGEDLNTDDYEFKSYINKKVKSDFEEITLNCISANEEKTPVGKANILKKNSDSFDFQLSFTRSGQTDILERLLMCSIHSNFSRKNERFSVTSKIAGNPALSHITYSPVLSGEYLVNGCELDFRAGKVRISAVGYSEDTAKLTDIPYD